MTGPASVGVARDGGQYATDSGLPVKTLCDEISEMRLTPVDDSRFGGTAKVDERVPVDSRNGSVRTARLYRSVQFHFPAWL